MWYCRHHHSRQAVTFTETGANTGIFTNWDDGLKQTCTLTQQQTEEHKPSSNGTMLNTLFFTCLTGEQLFNTDGQVEIGTGIGTEWNSGELVEIVLDDGDMNLDARSQEQMTVVQIQQLFQQLRLVLQLH